MVDETKTDRELAQVSVTVEIPGQIARDLEALVAGGVYLSADEVLRTWIGAGWRFEAGSFHTLRFDLARDREADPATKDEAGETGVPEQA